MFNCHTGRVSVTALTKKQRKEQKKMDRRHKANQLRRNKKDMVIFSSTLKNSCPLIPWKVLQSFHVPHLFRSWQRSDVSAVGTVLLIWLLWWLSMPESMLALLPGCSAGRALGVLCIRSGVSVASVTVLGWSCLVLNKGSPSWATTQVYWHLFS